MVRFTETLAEEAKDARIDVNAVAPGALNTRLLDEVLQAGPAQSAVMDTKGPKMLAEVFTPQARLAQHLKDVRLILDLGERVGSGLPLSTLHKQLLERAMEATPR